MPTCGAVQNQPVAVTKAKAQPPAENSVAERIRGWCRETGTSLRALSLAAGLGGTTAQTVCHNLETDHDVGLATLTALADAMGRPLTWLLYGGKPPEGIMLNSLPGWAEAVREARERLGVSVAAAEGVGRWRVPEAPPHLDALFVAALARAWSSST